MMHAVILPDDHAGHGETLEMIRQVDPRVLGQYRTVRIELTVDDARKLARAAKVCDDGLCDAEGALRFGFATRKARCASLPRRCVTGMRTMT